MLLFMAGKPKYAAGVPEADLVRVLCKKSCGKTVLHRLNRDAQDIQNPDERFAGCTATCLKCGGTAVDNYNFTSY